MIKEKNTWRHWINPQGKPMTGFYYEFKSFKVYWAYRWSEAEELDTKGVLGGTKSDNNIRSNKNYSLKYQTPIKLIPTHDPEEEKQNRKLDLLLVLFMLLLLVLALGIGLPIISLCYFLLFN